RAAGGGSGARRGGGPQRVFRHSPVDDLRENDRSDDDHGHEQPAHPDFHGRLFDGKAGDPQRALLLGLIGTESTRCGHDFRGTLAAGGGWIRSPPGWGARGCWRLERLAAREAFVQAVPEADLVLAEGPAEQYLLPVARRRGGEETSIEILDQRTNLVDARDAPGDPRDLLVEPLLHVLELVRLDVAAVPRDPHRDRRLAFLELHQGAAVPDQLLGQRTHLVERLVRLLGSEVPLLHARMIRPL